MTHYIEDGEHPEKEEMLRVYRLLTLSPSIDYFILLEPVTVFRAIVGALYTVLFVCWVICFQSSHSWWASCTNAYELSSRFFEDIMTSVVGYITHEQELSQILFRFDFS